MTLSRKLAFLFITSILLIATFLRVVLLDESPRGLHYDEAADTIIAREIAQGYSAPIFVEAYTGKEVLFFYWAAAWMRLIGSTSFAMRLAAAMMGVLTVAATYWAMREMFGNVRRRRPSASTMLALFGAAFLATSFWHVLMSRLGFRSIAEPCLQALAVAALWRGLRLDDRRWLLLGGVFVGLNLYTYLAARLFPVAIALLFIYLIVVDAGLRRERFKQFILVSVAALIVFMPLGIFFLQNPDAFLTRIAQVAPSAGQPLDVLSNIVSSLGMFFLKGDPYVRFNLPARPLFPSLLGVLFVIGVAGAIIGLLRRRSPSQRLRGAAYFFALTSTLIMLMSTALAVNDVTPSNLRGIGMIPMVFVFPALGTWMIVKWLINVIRERRVCVAHRAPSSVLVISLILVLLIGTFETANTYLNNYASLDQLYYESDGDLVDVADMLNKLDTRRTPTYVHTLHYRHPTLAASADDFISLRSITGPYVIVFPEGASTHVFAYLALPDHDWLDRFLDNTTQSEVSRGPDGQTNYEVIQFASAPSVEPQIQVNVNFDNIVELVGADLESIPESGGAVDVTLYWRVLDSPDRGDYATFVELRDGHGYKWGQANTFDYPSEQWMRGELIINRIQVPIAPGTPRGDYRLNVGWYSASGDNRLSVVTRDGGFGGTTAVVEPIEIVRASRSPDANDLGIITPLDAHLLDGLTLLGASLETPNVSQGGLLFFTLFWRADAVLDDMNIEIRLRQAAGGAATGVTSYVMSAPVQESYPFDEWMVGEVVADRYGLRVPVDVEAGDVTLEVRVGQGEWVTFGQANVEASARLFVVPAITHVLEVSFGDQIELLGYDLERESLQAGEALELTLYWRALRTPESDYTVFTHLLDAASTQRGGYDSPPLNGTYNTSLWIEDEVIIDTYNIPLEVDAPPGTYVLEIGMYLFESGQRLSLSSGGDALRLTAVEVVP